MITSRHNVNRSSAVKTSALVLLALCGSLTGCNTPDMPTMEDPLVARIDAQSLASSAVDRDRAGKRDEAIDLNRQAIARYRDLPQAWYNLGVLLLEKDQALEAAEAFRVASELMPTDPRPMKALGDVWAKQSYYDEAAKYYAQALERSENYLPALRESIRVDHIRDKRTEVSAERIQRALMLETDPIWREFFLRQKQITDRVLKR